MADLSELASLGSAAADTAKNACQRRAVAGAGVLSDDTIIDSRTFKARYEPNDDYGKVSRLPRLH